MSDKGWDEQDALLGAVAADLKIQKNQYGQAQVQVSHEIDNVTERLKQLQDHFDRLGDKSALADRQIMAITEARGLRDVLKITEEGNHDEQEAHTPER